MNEIEKEMILITGAIFIMLGIFLLISLNVERSTRRPTKPPQKLISKHEQEETNNMSKKSKGRKGPGTDKQTEQPDEAKVQGPTETEESLAKILAPFEKYDPDEIRLKAARVGETKEGGIGVMEVVEAAYEAHRTMKLRIREQEEAAICASEKSFNDEGSPTIEEAEEMLDKDPVGSAHADSLAEQALENDQDPEVGSEAFENLSKEEQLDITGPGERPSY